MKVLLVNDCPIGLPGSGGAEAHIKALYEGLEEYGHKPIFLSGQSRGKSATFSDGHYLIPHFNAPPLRKRPLRNYRNLIKALRTAKEIIEYENPDVIHVHNLLNPFALRVLRKLRPVVKSIHDCRPFCIKPPPYVATRLIGSTQQFCSLTFGLKCWSRCYMFVQRNPKDLIEAWSYFLYNLSASKEVIRSDKVVVYSDYLKTLALMRVRDHAKVELIYHFSDMEIRRHSKKADNSSPPILLFAGRFTPEKGIRHFLESIRKVPLNSFETKLVGDGPMRTEVENLIKELTPYRKIKTLGYVRHSQLFELYRQSSIVVFPSIGSEGCPLTGIEAMYCGTPVIAFDVGGVREWLINGETGLLVERGNTDELAKAITRLLLDPELRHKLGVNARSFVRKKFRRDLHIQKLISIYTELTNKKSNTSNTN